MALSLPNTPDKNIILGMTYLTVVFSILFQGTTFNYLVKHITRNAD
jgi:NhaP-type Na+/H+ or K+/H+ antiporter